MKIFNNKLNKSIFQLNVYLKLRLKQLLADSIDFVESDKNNLMLIFNNRPEFEGVKLLVSPVEVRCTVFGQPDELKVQIATIEQEIKNFIGDVPEEEEEKEEESNA